ncbi:hypothetical protein FACS1894190_09940 [Spirochaetia bacterium]|nr:hypothetical protein FACS1894190_09940 [Spirochaetia bacterium]
MADKKAIYAPGELDKVKERLGPIDEKDAKRMQRLLGGDVGYEKTEAEKEREAAEAREVLAAKTKKKPRHIVEVTQNNGEKNNDKAYNKSGGIIPNIGVASYRERVKMDICAGDTGFHIKTPWQVFVSRISFFRTPPDKVSLWFVRDKLNEYYTHIENLVTEVRLIFPRNNLERGTKMKKAFPFAFDVLNILRQWKIEVISSEISKIQSHPREVTVREFINLLREIYKPIFILRNLNTDQHIAEYFNQLYKVVYLENPSHETEKMLKNISVAVTAWQYISIQLSRRLYPLLMKILCVYYVPYDRFFTENEEKICLFLGISKEEQLHPPSISDTVSTMDKNSDDDNSEETETTDEESKENFEELSNKTEEERNMEAAETKARDRGLKILETLFPKAGWDRLSERTDLYPYFSDVLELKKSSDLISPYDPTQLALVLASVIEELLYGFRYIKFSRTYDGGKSLNSFSEEWHKILQESFERVYLPRVSEYAHCFEHSSHQRTSPYIANLVNDLHWIRRYYFLPYYDYTSPTPPTFAKKNVVALYPLVRHLRRELTSFAAAIDAANKEGGAAMNLFVDGISNPWEKYSFEVENAISKRLNMILKKEQRTNVSLIFFTLAIVTVLDNHLNDSKSIAYNTDNSRLFRSSDEAGLVPVFWVEKQTNTFQLFKQSLEWQKTQVKT